MSSASSCCLCKASLESFTGWYPPMFPRFSRCLNVPWAKCGIVPKLEILAWTRFLVRMSSSRATLRSGEGSLENLAIWLRSWCSFSEQSYSWWGFLVNDAAPCASSDSEPRRSAQEVLLLSMSAILKGVSWDGFGEASLRLSSSMISDILLDPKTVLFENMMRTHLLYSNLRNDSVLSRSIPSTVPSPRFALLTFSPSSTHRSTLYSYETTSPLKSVVRICPLLFNRKSSS